MSLPAPLTALSRNDLVKLVLGQQHQIAELMAKVEALQAEVERLKREGQRPAAPFSKGTRVAARKKPGRKPGKGLFRYRATPERVRCKLAQYAKTGSTLIDAWFRTAKEIQPTTNGSPAPDGPTVYVGAMWVGKNGIDPVNDHAWDFGSVSADPTSPMWYAAMWTMC
jgi:hypothetical protein